VKKVVDPIREDVEKYKLAAALAEVYSLFPQSLATDFACDRFLEGCVSDGGSMKRKIWFSLGLDSRLRKMSGFISQEAWQTCPLLAGEQLSKTLLKNSRDSECR
jgi:hypothetical protein